MSNSNVLNIQVILLPRKCAHEIDWVKTAHTTPTLQHCQPEKKKSSLEMPLDEYRFWFFTLGDFICLFLLAYVFVCVFFSWYFFFLIQSQYQQKKRRRINGNGRRETLSRVLPIADLFNYLSFSFVRFQKNVHNKTKRRRRRVIERERKDEMNNSD